MRSLNEIVYDYRLNVCGHDFWVPYWINLEDPPHYIGAPYRGKGRPGQLRRALLRRLGQNRPASGEEARQLMFENGLGIDCSGLVYYVLSQWLGQHRRKLSECLMVRREEVEAALRRHPERRMAMPAEMPALMSLADVCRRWHKDPIVLAGVRLFIANGNSVPVRAVGDARPGDIIVMKGELDLHVGVITEANKDAILLASSDDVHGSPSGVRLHRVRVIKPRAGISQQHWEGKMPEFSGPDGGIWRLRCCEKINGD